MTLFDQQHLVDLIAILTKAVATGVVVGVGWSVVFRTKTKPGE